MITYGIAIDAEYGMRQKRAYRCESEGDGFFPISNQGLASYVKGETQPNYPVPAIPHCYCGYSIEAHMDHIPCDYLGFLNYG